MSVRRSVAVAGTLAVLSAVTSIPAASAADSPDADPAAARVGASWLAGELEQGILTRFGYDDPGLTMDAGFALAEVGGQDAALAEIRSAVAARVGAYTTGEAYGEPDSVYANESAKTLDFAIVAGADPHAFGGRDLQAQLEGLVATTAPLTGRVMDRTPYSDTANVFGQAFAARALDAAGSDRADEVTTFLLRQQCADGGFRLFLSRPDAPEQGCGTEESHPDATAIVAIELAGRTDEPAVATSLTRALDRLAAQQRADGSFGGGPFTEESNANTTGLAGWALGLGGRTSDAREAAVWLRRQQAFDPAPCTTALTPDPGAVAYDPAALAAARADGGAHGQDQWRRASAQALPALLWAPAAPASLALAGPGGFVRAGSSQRLTLSGLAPGARGCLAGPGTAVEVTDTTQTRTVTLPAATGRRTFRLITPGGTVTRTLHALAAKTLTVGVARARLPRGTVQTIRTRGLAAGERVVVRVRGVVVRRGRADDSGRFVARVRATRPAGRAAVLVTGQFADLRRGTASYVVR